jgi:hypothetical protein
MIDPFRVAAASLGACTLCGVTACARDAWSKGDPDSARSVVRDLWIATTFAMIVAHGVAACNRSSSPDAVVAIVPTAFLFVGASVAFAVEVPRAPELVAAVLAVVTFVAYLAGVAPAALAPPQPSGKDAAHTDGVEMAPASV